MFVRAYGFMITEHDAERPLIVVGRKHRTVELDDVLAFYEWAHERWPPLRWTVELGPWQLSPR
jgi:hypothetical protein